jgi:integrase
MSVTLRSKQYKSGTHSFYLDIYQAGHRHTEFIDVTYRDTDSKDIKKEAKALAENIQAKRKLELESEQHGFIPQHKKKASFTDFYLNFLDNYKKNDIRMFKYAYEKFSEYTGFKRLSASQINLKLISGYKDYLESKEAGLSGETPYDYFRRFKFVIKKAYQEGLISSKEFELIGSISIARTPNNTLRKQVFTLDELKLLKTTRCGNEEVKRAFLFACFTGLGEAEIRSLTWSKIQNNKISLLREKTGQQIINDLPDSAIQLLGEKEDADKKIFSLPSNVAVSKNLKLWVKTAGIDKNISFYCGRHTFAVMLLTNGSNLKTVADCLGHTTTANTIKYLNYVDELKEKALKSLPII